MPVVGAAVGGTTDYSAFPAESVEGELPDEMDDGIWSCSTDHDPGLAGKFGLVVNNRSVVVRVADKEDGDFLLVYGVAGGSATERVQALEKKLSLPVRFILSSVSSFLPPQNPLSPSHLSLSLYQGAAHHMYLDLWYEAFPDARIIIPDRKIPQTRNGRELKERYADRWEENSGTTFTALKKYRDQVDFAIFDQWHLYPDQEFMTKNHNERNAEAESFFSYLRKFGSAPMTQPADAVWMHHASSGITFAEHNVQMW
jgi:hypothetical protein